ncbi:uncharacterized protein LOC124376630 [Silurus meridionalis]|uniref:Ig-like domain-containing protein n=1 Tax=Silurus meridionalis TaxID=175797 RepID=A0A8T0AGP8_SILME|nr:uncharacterized protein LOC124376630 [Silurus meridionalis]KAF7690633.1 hypothetical protein HF521_012437 [Silurus meridionalis]
MISLFVALYSLLCLCTAVKTSDIKELHVRTVKSGEDVTIACDLSLITDKSKVVWYRQSFGKVPQIFATPYGTNNYTFTDGFNDNRFNFTVNEHQFDLNIKNLREDDGGEYFCGEIELTTLKFTSGARLQFEDKEMKLCPSPGPEIKITGSDTHQGSNSSDENHKTEKHWILYALTTFSIISVIVIMVLVGVLFKNHRKGASSRKPEISSNQADDEDVLNYAAVSFAKKPSSSRTSRDQRHEDVYAQVQIK